MSPGFHRITAEDYHADRVAPEASLSSSLAQVLLRESPRKAWHSHPRLNPKFKADTDSKFDIGTASHAVLLENDASKIVIVTADDWRTKAAKEQRAAAYADGRTPLLEKHYDAVREMVDAALAFIEDSEIAEGWHEAESEATIVWVEDVDGFPVWLRARLDRVTLDRDLIMDYKTTTDAAPDPFSRQLVRMGYHIQEAFYRRGVRALGKDRPEFVFLAQSCEPPFECSLHACDAALQEIADAEVERAIRIWKTCLSSNQWPSYGGRIHYAIPSNFLMNDHEMRLAEAA